VKENLVLRMAKIISRKADVSGLVLAPIHFMDRVGHLQGIIKFLNHQMKIENWWENCGATGEDITCSCGFASRWFSGGGCWQFSHNGPAMGHEFDLVHAALYNVAKNI